MGFCLLPKEWLGRVVEKINTKILKKSLEAGDFFFSQKDYEKILFNPHFSTPSCAPSASAGNGPTAQKLLAQCRADL